MVDGIRLTGSIAGGGDSDADDPHALDDSPYAPGRSGHMSQAPCDALEHIAHTTIARCVRDEEIIADTRIPALSLAWAAGQGELRLRGCLSATEAIDTTAITIPDSVIFGE